MRCNMGMSIILFYQAPEYDEKESWCRGVGCLMWTTLLVRSRVLPVDVPTMKNGAGKWDVCGSMWVGVGGVCRCFI